MTQKKVEVTTSEFELMQDADKCDECSVHRSTLYDRSGKGEQKLLCGSCVPQEETMGVNAFKLMKTSVTGRPMILGRRRLIAKRQLQA